MPDLNLKTLFCIVNTAFIGCGDLTILFLSEGDEKQKFKNWIQSVIDTSTVGEKALAQLAAWPDCPEDVRINAAKSILNSVSGSMLYEAYRHYFKPWTDR